VLRTHGISGLQISKLFRRGWHAQDLPTYGRSLKMLRSDFWLDPPLEPFLNGWMVKPSSSAGVWCTTACKSNISFGLHQPKIIEKSIRTDIHYNSYCQSKYTRESDIMAYRKPLIYALGFFDGFIHVHGGAGAMYKGPYIL
jgi:hypothetical protein